LFNLILNKSSRKTDHLARATLITAAKEQYKIVTADHVRLATTKYPLQKPQIPAAKRPDSYDCCNSFGMGGSFHFIICC